MIRLVGCDTNSLRKWDFHGLSERSLPAQSVADANRRNHIGHEYSEVAFDTCAARVLDDLGKPFPVLIGTDDFHFLCTTCFRRDQNPSLNPCPLVPAVFAGLVADVSTADQSRSELSWVLWKRVGRHGPAVEHESHRARRCEGLESTVQPRLCNEAAMDLDGNDHVSPATWCCTVLFLRVAAGATRIPHLGCRLRVLRRADDAFHASPGAHWPRRDGRIDGSCPQLEWRFGASNVERGNLAIAREGVLQGRTDGEDRRLVPSDRSGKICYRSLTAHGRTRESRDNSAHSPPHTARIRANRCEIQSAE